MSNPELLLTGHLFEGQARAIGPVVQEVIREAKRELHLMTFSITTTAPSLLPLLTSALARGVRTTIVVDHLENQPVGLQQVFAELEAAHPHLILANFADPSGGSLHAKVLVADRRIAVLGSANFTWGGFVRNHELAVMLRGSSARALALAIDRIAQVVRRKS